MDAAVLVADAAGQHGVDAAGDGQQIGPLRRFVIIGGIDQPLAGGAIIGPQFFAQHGVADILFKVHQAIAFDFLHHRRFGIDDALGKTLDIAEIDGIVADRIDRFAALPEHGFFRLGIGELHHRHDPLWRPLKMHHLDAALGQRGDELHAGRAIANDADFLAFQRHRMVPARRMEFDAGKIIKAGDVGGLGMMQHAGRRDDEFRLGDAAVAGFDLPVAGRVAPGAADDLGIEIDDRHQVVIGDDLFEIGLHLGAGGVIARPFGVGGEFIGIGVRRHVAAQPGIAVVAPGAADAIGLFIDADGGVAGCAQLDGGKDAGHAGTQDDEAGLWLRHGRSFDQKRTPTVTP